MTETFQSRVGREDEPIILLRRHFILPQQEVQCANSPLSDWTLNHVNTHPTCLHTLCRCQTLALTITHPPHTPSVIFLKDPSHQNSKLCFIFNTQHWSRSSRSLSILNVRKSRFQTVSCPVKSQEEWGRVSPHMSWRALSLLPQKLPCNLDSKWSPGWLSAKTNYFLLHTCPSSFLPGFYFTLLSSIYHLKLEFVTFFISHPSSFTWGLFARCVFFFCMNCPDLCMLNLWFQSVLQANVCDSIKEVWCLWL